jgi:hypothetical protein
MNLMLLLASTALAATTTADCAKAYKKCKSDVAHIFDQKPCKKKRASCEADVANYQAQVIQNSTKNKMMNGTVDTDKSDGLDNFAGRNNKPIDKKEEAKRRLEERERAKLKVTEQPEEAINNF